MMAASDVIQMKTPRLEKSLDIVEIPIEKTSRHISERDYFAKAFSPKAYTK
jgi:hypothetical protein